MTRAVADAKLLYDGGSESERLLRMNALETVNSHWCCNDENRFRNWQQLRHLSLVAGFCVVTVVASLGTQVSGIVAYLIGAIVIVAGEIWIFARRVARDRRFIRTEEELRQLGMITK